MDNKYNYLQLKKSELRQLSISDIKEKLPDLKNTQGQKSKIIGNWLVSWITKSLQQGSIKVNDIIPSKKDFAYYLGVSIGTMQNAFRYIEDLGYVESKQRVGTMVKNKDSNAKTIRKLTSKKDLAVEAIKQYLITEEYEVGEKLPSTTTISVKIGFGANTTRLALETLESFGILRHKQNAQRQSGWFLKSSDITINGEIKHESETLVKMVEKDIEDFISKNLHIGDKIPAHYDLADMFKTSLKTIHDALCNLGDKGIVHSRRGRYGTIVVKMPNSKTVEQRPESSIFAPAKDAAFYYYEKTQKYIMDLIIKEYKIGDKLPSVKEMAEKLDLSPNTIRQAYHNLAEEGYLVFSRGRYGGTFIIDIPEADEPGFKWIAVNPQFAKEYSEQ